MTDTSCILLDVSGDGHASLDGGWAGSSPGATGRREPEPEVAEIRSEITR